MSEKIYVGNLSWNASDSDLEDLFSEYGEVLSAQIILDRETNRSRGFGFVEMADKEAASKAIATLNGSKWMERDLKVNVAEKRERRNNQGYR